MAAGVEDKSADFICQTVLEVHALDHSRYSCAYRLRIRPSQEPVWEGLSPLPRRSAVTVGILIENSRLQCSKRRGQMLRAMVIVGASCCGAKMLDA